MAACKEKNDSANQRWNTLQSYKENVSWANHISFQIQISFLEHSGRITMELSRCQRISQYSPRQKKIMIDFYTLNL